MVDWEKQKSEEVPKEAAVEVLKFIANQSPHNQTQTEALGFLNDFEVTAALSSIINIHGEKSGPYSSNQSISASELEQSFESVVCINSSGDSSLLQLRAFKPELEKPLFAAVFYLNSDGSINKDKLIRAVWGEQVFSYDPANPNDDGDSTYPLLAIVQGSACRIINILESDTPLSSIVEIPISTQIAA